MGANLVEVVEVLEVVGVVVVGVVVGVGVVVEFVEVVGFVSELGFVWFVWFGWFVSEYVASMPMTLRTISITGSFGITFLAISVLQAPTIRFIRVCLITDGCSAIASLHA